MSAEPICPSSSPTLRFAREVWMCTRDGGHDGDHEARDAIGVLLARWPQTDADPSSEPVSAEPTAEQRETAMVACGHRGWATEQLSLTQRERVGNVARALAAAVTAEREKYVRLADELDQDAVDDDVLRTERCVEATYGWELRGQSRMARNAARRIREVSS